MNRARPLFYLKSFFMSFMRCIFFTLSSVLFMHDVILIVYKRCARFTGKRWHTMHQAFCNFILSLWPCISQVKKLQHSHKTRTLGSFVWIASEQMNNSKDKKGHMEKGKNDTTMKKWRLQKELQRNCKRETRKYTAKMGKINKIK